MQSFLNAFKAHIMNLRMRTKITLLCVMVITASTAFTGLISYQGAAKIIEKNVYRQTSETILQSVNFLNEKLNSVLTQSHLLQTNQDFALAMKDIVTEKEINYALEQTRVDPILNQMKARDRFIQSIFVYTPKAFFYNVGAVPKSGLEITSTDLFRKVNQDGLIFWGIGGKDEIFIEGRHVIPIIMKITIFAYDANDMFVVVNLKSSAFVEYLSKITPKIKGEIYIINSNNEIVAGMENGNYQNTLSDPKFRELLAGTEDSGYFRFDDELFVNVSTFPINSWRMVSIQKEKDIKSDVEMIKGLVILSGLVFVSITILLSIQLAASITRHINRLQKLMETSASKQFSTRFEAKYTDEIGQLGRSFNNMSDQIQTLLEEIAIEQEHVKKEQQLVRRAELKALQAQINPHFLYNALDSIYWRSMMAGNELVSEMAISLANIFRIGLNKGKELTTVYNELQHVENYLKIQKIVYEGKFEYSIRADKEAYEYSTVKLILQPLVENSILHGFKDMETGGKIEIGVSLTDDSVKFEVTDNGCGFENDKVLDAIKNPDMNYGGYALGNVFQRIQLHYGDAYGLTLTSKPFEETKITICIPKLKGDV